MGPSDGDGPGGWCRVEPGGWVRRRRRAEPLDRDRFVAICGKCRKGRIIHPTRLKKPYGNERVSRLERKLKCSGCGNIRGNWFLLAEAED